MRTKTALVICIVLITGIFLYSGVSQKEDTQETKELQETRGLIRKDLLVLGYKNFPSPRRNIFVRQMVVQQQGEIFPSNSGSFQIPNSEDSPPAKKTEPEDVRLDLNYIGYVKSGDRVVALVLWEGEAYSVESGDILAEGVTIGEISPDEIEIIRSDSVSRRIRLEGEQP